MILFTVCYHRHLYRLLTVSRPLHSDSTKLTSIELNLLAGLKGAEEMTAAPLSTISREQPGQSPRLKYFCWAIAALVGFVQVVSRYASTDPDAISYLDIADAYMRGDWHNAINAYWSPLYSWLLAFTFAIFKPSAYWEFAVAHMVNYVLFLCSLLCFSLLLEELLRHRRRAQISTARPEAGALPEWMWTVIGYTLFLWSAVEVINVTRPTPDIFVSGVVYLAAALTLRMCAQATNWRIPAALGLALGLGYLAKAAMFPVGGVFLCCNLLCGGFSRPALRRALIAIAAFVIVSTPFITILSLKKGYLTIGDSGRLNYSWSVNKNTRWMHWQGDVPRSGTPLHPTRVVLNNPRVYEFGEPVGGTFPPWYDPTYWHEGVRVYFDFKQQVRAFSFNLFLLSCVFLYFTSSRLVTFLLLFLGTLSLRRYSGRDARALWMIIIPALFTMFMYALVIVVPRYIGPFAVILILGLLSGVRLPEGRWRSIVSRAVCVILIATVVAIGWKPFRNAYVILHQVSTGQEPHEDWQIAQTMKDLGVRPGDKVASVGYEFMPAWARLTRTKVVAEMVPNDLFKLTPEENDRLIAAFQKAGAKVAVGTPKHLRVDPDIPLPPNVPPDDLNGFPPEGWLRVNNLYAFIYVLPPPQNRAQE